MFVKVLCYVLYIYPVPTIAAIDYKLKLPHNYLIDAAINYAKDQFYGMIGATNAYKNPLNFTTSTLEFTDLTEIEFTCSMLEHPKSYSISFTYKDVNYVVPTWLEKDVNVKGKYVMNITSNVTATCSTNMAQANLKLIYQQPKPSPAPTATANERPADVEANDQSSNAQDNSGPGWQVWAGIAAALFVILILIIAMIKYYKYRQKEQTRAQARGNYENFSNETSSVTPNFPNACLEETYLTPADSRESPYSNIKHINDTGNYTVPYVPRTTEEMYTQVVPKNERNGKPAVPQRTVKDAEPNYAELNTKVPNITAGRYINVSESPYAEIMPKNKLYANLDANTKNRNEKSNRDGYTNVFNNESYVNSQKGESSDYAEPSYCEVNRRF